MNLADSAPGQSLATSGSDEKEFLVEGRKVSHLIHPQTVLSHSALRCESFRRDHGAQ